MKKTIYLFLVLCFVLLIGCENNSTKDDTPSYLFKAIFTNNWLQDNIDAFLFISDESGSLIAEKEITGDGIYTFDIPEERELDFENLMVSTLEIDRYYEYYNFVYMYTYGEIDIGEEYTFFRANYSRDNIGSIKIDFENIPDHTGYLLSTNRDYYYSNYNSLTTIYYYLNLFFEPDFLYVQLNTDESGPLYNIVDPVYAGDSLTIDLENAQSAENQTITFTPIGNNGTLIFRGYNEEGNYHSGYHRLTENFNLDQSIGEFEVIFPPNTFNDFRTSISLYEDDCNWPLYNSYYYNCYGNIPAEFKMIQADLEILDFDHQSMELFTSGNIDVLQSCWFYKVNDLSIRWYIYNDPNQTYFQIPELPSVLPSEYPQINQDSFSLYYVSANDFTELSSYDDYLETMFKSGDYFDEQVKELCSRQKSSGLYPKDSIERCNSMLQFNERQ